MVSPKASLLSALNVLRAAVQAGNALSHLRPPADRTARGACEKRTLPDRSTSRPMDDGPAARLHPHLAYAIPAAFIRPRLTGNAVSTRFRPFSFARYRALSAAFSTSSVSEFCFAEVATPMLTVTESGAGTFSCAS